MTVLTLSLLLGLSLLPGHAASAGSRLSQKPYGVLLLAENSDHAWKSTEKRIKDEMAKAGLPFEFAAGLADGQEIQKRVERLQSQRVKKIVAVPLFLSSFSEVMDQNRYLFGIREKPSAELTAGPHAHPQAAGTQKRIKLQVPIVMTKALDAQEAVVEVLAARAKAQSRNPSKEILVLVGQATRTKEGIKDWISVPNALAEKVRQKLGLSLEQAAALFDEPDRKARDKSEAEIRKAIKTMRRQGPVIIVALELSPGLVHNRLPRVLEGVFARYDGRTMLADPRFAQWVATSASQGAKLPDMRVFKDSGGGPKLAQTPSQLNSPSQLNQTGGFR